MIENEGSGAESQHEDQHDGQAEEETHLQGRLLAVLRTGVGKDTLANLALELIEVAQVVVDGLFVLWQKCWSWLLWLVVLLLTSFDREARHSRLMFGCVSVVLSGLSA